MSRLLLPSAATIARSTSSASASKCCACFANSSRLCRTVVRALINAASAPIGAGFPNGFDSPSSAGVTGFVRIIHLLEETADYGHSVFDLIATEAVDRCFGAVIDQFQPKQRRAINIGRRIG